jgi:glycosyltransferase involved in cell wall biosynthesis
MRILLVANYEPDAQQSMQRYADWLANALIERGHTVTMARPKPFFSRLTFGKFHRIQKYLGYLDKFLLFPPRLRLLAMSFDLVHVIDHSNSMYLGAAGSRPALITCHDLLAVRAARGEFPVTRTGWSGRILQRWILDGLANARNIVCVSEKTSTDLLALINYRPSAASSKNIRVIFNALNWPFKPTTARPHFEGIPENSRAALLAGAPYIFHVGGNQWYKNRLGVIKIFAELRKHTEFSNMHLLMAGKPWTRPMRDFVTANNLAGCAIELGAMSSEELQAYYSHALALLFPSLEEGFGWPIVEAQACGCPVITTARPPMNEVAGAGPNFPQPAAILIEPEQPAAAAVRIVTGLNSRSALIEAGFKNIHRFNEEAIINSYCDFYQFILNQDRQKS